MGILEEIREYFASTQNGAREIKTLSNDYPAIVIRNNEGYGVAIEFDDAGNKFKSKKPGYIHGSRRNE